MMTRNATVFAIQEAINEAKYLIDNIEDSVLATAMDPVLELLEQTAELAEEVADTLDDLPDEYEEE